MMSLKIEMQENMFVEVYWFIPLGNYRKVKHFSKSNILHDVRYSIFQHSSDTVILKIKH